MWAPVIVKLQVKFLKKISWRSNCEPFSATQPDMFFLIVSIAAMIAILCNVRLPPKVQMLWSALSAMCCTKEKLSKFNSVVEILVALLSYLKVSL